MNKVNYDEEGNSSGDANMWTKRNPNKKKKELPADGMIPFEGIDEFR